MSSLTPSLYILNSEFQSYVQDILFYQLPEHSHYYSDIVNMLGGASGGDEAFEAAHATVSVLFSPLDAARLERVVGSARVGKMLKGGSRTFLFC